MVKNVDKTSTLPKEAQDELDAMMRHILDKDWGQVAWRAMANLEKHLEEENK